MSTFGIPLAPPPPAPMRVSLLPQTSPLTFKQQLLLEGLKIHKHGHGLSSDIPTAPPLPRAMLVHPQPMSRPFKDLLYMGAENMRQHTLKRGRAPPPPPPMMLSVPMQPMKFKKQLALAVEDMKRRSMMRGEFDSELSSRSHYPPSPPPRPEPLMVRNPLDHPIGQDVARAAMQMREAHYPPRAPAAPAPMHVQGPPLWHPIKEDIEKVADHMLMSHQPPLAPSPPAPMLLRLKQPSLGFNDELALAVAGRNARTAGVTKRAVPLAPPPPAPYRFRHMPVARTLNDELPHALTKVMSSRRMASMPRSRSPLRRSVGPMEAPLPASASLVPPMAPRSVSAETVPALHVPGPLVHEPERIIQHKPVIEKEIIKEHPIEVKVERHIQPVVHETVHQIQPVIKTQVTADTRVIVTDTNVVLPPIVEAPVIVNAAPAAVPVMAAPVGVTATTVLPPGAMAPLPAVAPMMAGEREIPLAGVSRPSHGLTGAKSPTATGHRRGSLGQKIKGALKEVQGTITRNPAKKEEGRMLLHGQDPANVTSSTAPTRT